MTKETLGSTFSFRFKIITIMLVFLMGIWGCLGIYNATVFSGAPFYFAGKQLLWLFIGMITLFVAAKIPFKNYKTFVILLSCIAYAMLLFLFVAGVRINGMYGWFDLHYFYIQPSEIAKPFFLLSLCVVSNFKHEKFYRDTLKFFSLLSLTVLWCLPIVMEPDFGTVLVYLAGFTIVYFISNGKMRFLVLFLFLLTLFSIYVIYSKPYVILRIKGFLYPENNSLGAGWHTLQLQYTMARGGLAGQQWGHSLWANSYLPLPFSDSAFASLVEAIGFLGALPVIASFCILSYAGYKLASGLDDGINKNFVYSIIFLIVFQALLHISVNVTMLPATGITLPLFSYGGSSMLATMLCIGMMLSASQDNS